MLFLPQLNFAGMAQNVNAFAVQITVAIAIFCVLQGRFRGPRAGSWMSILVLAILIQGIVNSGSRSGLLAGSVVLLVALALRCIALKTVLLSMAVAAGILVTPTALHALFEYSVLQLPAPAHVLGNMLRPSADAERWYTILRGVQLWMEHPVLGSGLGTFVTTVQAERGQFLVIHNSSIWLLAEFGLVGFLIFALAFAAIARAALSAALRGETWAQTLLLVLVACAIFQLPHDVLYQRIFWLVFGATLFAGRWQRSGGRDLATGLDPSQEVEPMRA
jgi:O-antigen ligase